MSDPTAQIAKVNSLENGKGLYYLLNEAYKILGNPSVLFDMSYTLLACTENIITDDNLWNEIIETGTYSAESIAFFKDEDFIDTVASTKTIAFLKSDKLKHDRLYGRILNINNSTVADLVTVACNKPFESDDPLIFEAFCEKLSKEISTSEFFRQYGVIYHEDRICRLLDKDFDDRIIHSDHISNLYEGLNTILFVAVADIGKCDTKDNRLQELRDLFKRTQPELKYAVYSDYIVIIVSTEDKSLDVNRDLNKLSGLFDYNDIYVGISNPFENLFDLRRYYNEAVEALTNGLKNSRHRRIFSYDDTER